MMLHESDEALPHHSGAADNANFVLFHNMNLLLSC